jgi:hypothetical protein
MIITGAIMKNKIGYCRGFSIEATVDVTELKIPFPG